MRKFETNHNYDEMEAYVLSHIDTYLPEEYRGMIKADIVTKANGVKLHGIRLEGPEADDNGTKCCPTLYLEHSQPGATYDSICKEIAKILVEATGRISQIPEFSKKFILDNVRLYMVSKEKNELDFAHEFEDMLVGFRCLFETEDGAASFVVTKDMAEKHGISTEEAYKAAELNTLASASISEITLTAMAIEAPIYAPNFMHLSMAQIECMKGILPYPFMLIVRGKEQFHSAATILCKEVQEKLSAIYEWKDYFVIPSSVHECITVCVSDEDEKKINLKEMVSTVNQEMVASEEILSNSVYRYTRGKGLYLVTE